LDKESRNFMIFFLDFASFYFPIFLVDVNDRTCPLLPYDFSYWDEERKSQHIKAEKALMYVAISRTVQKVFISGIGEKSSSILIE